jgi:hypothetical protein
LALASRFGCENSEVIGGCKDVNVFGKSPDTAGETPAPSFLRRRVSLLRFIPARQVALKNCSSFARRATLF